MCGQFLFWDRQVLKYPIVTVGMSSFFGYLNEVLGRVDIKMLALLD